jgi:hypothetical protein
MDLLTLLVIVFIVIWLTGSLVIGGNAIHFLIIVIVILVLVKLLQGQRL